MSLEQIIGLAIVFLLALGILVAFREVRDLPTDDMILCPHGYANWDDCPDCRH